MPVNRLQPRVDHTTLTTGAVMTLTRNDPQGGAATFLPRVHTETFDHCQVARNLKQMCGMPTAKPSPSTVGRTLIASRGRVST